MAVFRQKEMRFWIAKRRRKGASTSLWGLGFGGWVGNEMGVETRKGAARGFNQGGKEQKNF